VTCLDGHAMAQNGRGGVALAIAALASLLAGCLTTILIAVAAPPLAEVALAFQSADYVAVLLLGLIAAIVLSHGSLIKSIAAIVIGVLIGTVGTDVSTGEYRLTFGIQSLADGIDFVPVAMGLFGLAEIIANLEATRGMGRKPAEVAGIWPSFADLKAGFMPALRGTAIGAAFGLLPGGGPTIGAFSSYSVEKKISATPERFGHGAIEGVAAPEAANNAAAQASFIPMLSLGIPPNALMALMIGAMMIHGITPGPNIITKQPELFWGVIASMWIGNIILVLLNLPLIRFWILLLRIPYRFLFPSIIVLCCIGTYSINNTVSDVFLMAGFGVFGWVLKKLDFEAAPLLMGLVLGPMLEENFRRALSVSNGDLMIFVQRPISASLLAICALLLIGAALPSLRRKRQTVFAE
jgi:putative tricarboxylic transport membrane protein